MMQTTHRPEKTKALSNASWNQYQCYFYRKIITYVLDTEGFWPEWCILSMIYSGDTPFWSEILDTHCIHTNLPPPPPLSLSLSVHLHAHTHMCTCTHTHTCPHTPTGVKAVTKSAKEKWFRLFPTWFGKDLTWNTWWSVNQSACSRTALTKNKREDKTKLQQSKIRHVWCPP